MTPTTILLEVKQIAEDLMIRHGLRSSYIWRFEFDNAKRRFGSCNCEDKIISLSKPLILNNWETNRNEVMNVILHEIAHGLVWMRYELYGKNVQAHGREWKAICIEIGAKPECYYKIENVNAVEGKYKYKCPHCDKETYYYKLKRRDIACGDCCKKYNNNKYSPEYILKLVWVKGHERFQSEVEPMVEKKEPIVVVANDRYKEVLWEKVRQRTADRSDIV